MLLLIELFTINVPHLVSNNSFIWKLVPHKATNEDDDQEMGEEEDNNLGNTYVKLRKYFKQL